MNLIQLIDKWLKIRHLKKEINKLERQSKYWQAIAHTVQVDELKTYLHKREVYEFEIAQLKQQLNKLL